MDAVEELLAKQAVTEVLYRYCRGIDRMDADLVRSCWHPGGVADYGPAVHQGTGDSFVDWVFPVHAQGFAGHSHQITNVLVDVGADGRHAVSEAYVTVVLRTLEGQDITDRGRYLDRWEQRDGRWAIVHRRHVSDLGAVYGLLADPTADAAAASRRDRSDPSYELLG